MLGDDEGLFFIVDGAIAARDHGDLRFDSHIAGLRLVTEIDNSLRARADELDVAFGALLGEIGILCEEAVAWVNAIDISDFGCGDDTITL